MAVYGRVLIMVALASMLAACDAGSPTQPTTGAIVTFEVGDERFRAWLTTPEQIAAARAALAGGSAQIPNGRIVDGTEVNTGWSWHLADVKFAEVTMELCDGRPSDVERDGTAFGGGRYCPWGARVVSIEDL